ncbi:DUF3833 domain-containing protein [Alphaproteobacteria bacterium]|nr:DUF3833 domain-containing protein [Alphaproteobacteria bacterium]
MAKKSSRIKSALNIVTALFLLGGTLGVVSACARNDVTALAERGPKFVLEEFFAGDSVAYGVFEDRFGNLRRQFRVNLNGQIEGNKLTLVEDFLYDDGERADRTWVIENLGQLDNGAIAYRGTAADVSGAATGSVVGNGLNWRYDVVLEMNGRQIEVNFDDWIYQQDENVAINRAYITKYGVEIGSVSIVFLRGAAAEAVGPLDLESW